MRINWLRVLIGVVLITATGAIAAWRVVPRPPAPATNEMIAASRTLRQRVAAAMGSQPTPPAAPQTDRERLLAAAFKMQGIPYRWGAKGPEALDCSGFSKAAYRAAHTKLPDGSFNQARGELPVTSLDDLAPGDLLFYRWEPTEGVTHVTIYAGNGWAIGTGSPGQPKEVVVYPLAEDLKSSATVLTYRHIVLSDER